MNYRRFFWLMMIIAVSSWYGCVSTPTNINPVEKVTNLGPVANLAVKVTTGNIMLQAQKGDHFDAYELKEEIKCSVLGNSCTLSPQVFVRAVQDDEFYYPVSSKDYVKPFALNWQNAGYLSKCPCGLKVSRTNMKVEGVIFEYENGTVENMCSQQSESPLERIMMIDIYAPNFLRKTIKFDSFSDDFLSLRYKEERGTPNSYDAKGNPVAVPPNVTERIYEFDLKASGTINIQGAELEIVQAKADGLVYKIIRNMSME